ncbi:MAG TPA: hypothetical protein VLG13_03475 [Patescibacteria group bacterium]|nr:hypothetical protein [Patescibacteria group bacterium]
MKDSRTIQTVQQSYGSYGIQLNAESRRGSDVEPSDTRQKEVIDEALAVVEAATALELARFVRENRAQWSQGTTTAVVESPFSLGGLRYDFTHTIELKYKVDETALEQLIATRIMPPTYKFVGSHIGEGRHGVMPIPSLETIFEGSQLLNGLVRSIFRTNSELTGAAATSSRPHQER